MGLYNKCNTIRLRNNIEKLFFSRISSDSFNTKSLSKRYISGQTNIQNLTAPLDFKNIKYNGVEIKLSYMPNEEIDTSDFAIKLYTTLTLLKEQGKKAVFLKVPMYLAHFIPVAANYGFKYHNAEGDDATMVKWLPNSESKVPVFATHHLGVGGAVLSNNKLLVVREKDHGQGPRGWKLPGGLVNLNEEISSAVIREIYEETGINSSFKEVLGFRHSLDVQFGRGDIYVICRLEALSDKIIVDEEVEEASWIPLEDFESQNKYAMLKPITAMLKDSLSGVKTGGFSEYTLPSTVPNKSHYKFYSH